MTLPLFQTEPSLGGTGTQIGMNAKQLLAAEQRLFELYRAGYRFFHHGDCIGADAQMHAIALRIGYHIIIHPPANPAKRAFCQGAYRILPPKPYLDRNHDIVDASQAMIAAPKEIDEQLRSGTWATIRYARKQKKTLYMLWPKSFPLENRQVSPL